MMAKAGVLGALLSLLESKSLADGHDVSDTTTLTDAATTLARLMRVPFVRERFVGAPGAIKRVFELVHHPVPRLCRAAMRVLAAVCARGRARPAVSQGALRHVFGCAARATKNSATVRRSCEPDRAAAAERNFRGGYGLNYGGLGHRHTDGFRGFCSVYLRSVVWDLKSGAQARAHIFGVAYKNPTGRMPLAAAARPSAPRSGDSSALSGSPLCIASRLS